MENNWNRPSDYTNQRDAFIGNLFKIAQKDKDVILISIDMGAAALDQWREELPDQFIWTGISEQHSINLAAGLAACGKKVYVYFMAAWSARCFEQIRYSCAMADNPITLLANGVALGYAPAGPAHETNDDIAYMRSLLGIEINCPASVTATEKLVEESYNNQRLRYVRLERHYDQRFDALDKTNTTGISTVKGGLFNNALKSDKTKSVIVSYGYMLGRCLDTWIKIMDDSNHEVTLMNMSVLKPNPITAKTFDGYDKIICVEEQTASGGFGSIVLEGLSDAGVKKDLLRITLPERYIFENGDRNYRLNNNGLSVDSIYNKVLDFVNED